MDLTLAGQVHPQLLEVIQRVEESGTLSPGVIDEKADSARNLQHYMAFRHREISDMQHALGQLGLSRFARAEGHILHSLHLVDYLLRKLLGDHPPARQADVPSPDQALRLLAENTRRLLGSRPQKRRMMIMVTLPTEAAHDPSIADTLLQYGMNCARINCAHDSPREWTQMIQHARAAAERQQKSLRIAMDLGGPKIRTGEIHSHRTDKKGRPFLLLRQGDVITMSDDSGSLQPDYIPITYPGILKHVRAGERVFFDDGKIEGIIRPASQGDVRLEIIKAQPGGAKLRADKGVNFPDSELKISGLTAKDKEDFHFVARHADIVNFSFVNSISDLDELYGLLDEANAHTLGVVLKIETKRAYNNLSQLLLHTMKRPNPFGVMIARGDLAIEAGWENMGYIQRELLRISTAAHLPIIWATQVLENLAKRGIPVRSEMTDIAQSMKAECVMLNKGPYITEALSFLDQFLVRGEAFQQKNKSMLPTLHELI